MHLAYEYPDQPLCLGCAVCKRKEYITYGHGFRQTYWQSARYDTRTRTWHSRIALSLQIEQQSLHVKRLPAAFAFRRPVRQNKKAKTASQSPTAPCSEDDRGRMGRGLAWRSK